MPEPLSALYLKADSRVLNRCDAAIIRANASATLTGFISLSSYSNFTWTIQVVTNTTSSNPSDYDEFIN